MSSEGGGCDRRGINTILWIVWIITTLSSLAFGVMALLVVNGLIQYSQESTIDLEGVAARLTGVIGSCGIFLVALSFYLVLSLVVLLGRLCSGPEALDFRYGAFAAYSLCMFFISAQTTLAVQASNYLVQSFVEFDPVVPVLGSSDEQLFTATIIQGYVTGSFFLLLSLFILTHQFAVCCGYCPSLSPEKAKKKKSSSMTKGPQVKPSGSKPVPREV